ncbi:alpha-L-rhamnosidase [Nocardia panacis]|uniref:alpha-L-rhamnosidase n=1 Tax=Nocardia panacis TaxID=2340916 RepID=A0A3A4KV45_9NOCA|nr:alpha-L-rhamnosidase [Nocardia panacis]RJO73734.1 alpha-L-rhamnosidase [Nocardia panacis]
MKSHVSAPSFEHHRQALGIGEARPRISWTTRAPAEWRQDGYEIEVVRANGEVFRSGRIAGADSALVAWPTRALDSRESAQVRVGIWSQGTESVWGPSATVEAGLLDPADWVAVPVGGAWPDGPDKDRRRPPLVRTEFPVQGKVVRARLYITAHGVFRAEINGRRVGIDAMAPGWTVYPKRLRYYTYDVKDHLQPGANALGALLGDGWYRSRIGLGVYGDWDRFGTDLSLLAQLEIDYADGRRQIVATGPDWTATPGPILFSGNYDGETYDARQEIDGWSEAGTNAGRWEPVAVAARDPRTLVAPEGPPVRCTEEVRPVAVLRTPSGRSVLDFGQNLVGRLRIRVAGPVGSRIVLRHAEVMQDGEIYTVSLRTAKATDTYVLRGRGTETWEPAFTFHGFRYAEIDGWPGDLAHAVAAGDIVARVYHTDMVRTGWFDCSDQLLNRLHENAVWSMRGNFLDIPTDCPQRHERLGWTGDIQLFAPTAAYLYDCSGMLSSWLRDVAADQLPDGTVTWYTPYVPTPGFWTYPPEPSAVWGDVAALTPWVLYERFGDPEILRRQYDSARAWVDLVDRLAGESRIWESGHQLGDWLDPSAPAHDPADGRTDRYLVATAYFAWSSAHLARYGEVLDRPDDATHYRKLAQEVRDAFVRRFYDRDTHRLTSDSQTAYSLALAFDLLPEDERAAAADRLAELAAAEGFRIGTGLAGTASILDALSKSGRFDIAYRLLRQTECPSWLYPVVRGATTIWERWDSLRPDTGRVLEDKMVSFNHYALGAVADWMHRNIAGLAPAAPGYRTVLFQPRPGGGITSARARHTTPFGDAAIEWRIHEDVLDVGVSVPQGSDAIIDIPGTPRHKVGSGAHRYRSPWTGELAATAWSSAGGIGLSE